MHRFRATLTAVVLVAASVALSGPADAGGPTSALLSVPGGGRTASLYYTDPEYDALAGLVGIEGGTGSVDRSGASHANGPEVTVTWLIHDVLPWRVDRIYLGGAGAPWIATQESDGGGEIWDGPVVWHQSASPTALVGLLEELGVGASATGAHDVDGGVGAAQPAVTEPTPEPPDPVPGETSSSAGIWWSLVGVAAGALLTLLWQRRRRPEAEPLQPPADEGVDPPGLLVAEELSWPAPRA